jgi:serine/threonine-protein kinase
MEETKASATFHPGDIVGSYRIEARLGEGGMGEVYAAAHIYLPRRAAIKVLRASLVGEPLARDGLLREACMLEGMVDPRVTRLYDAGELADGRPWIAMELVDGQCLADLLEKRGVVDLSELSVILRAIIDALEAAHACGTVHGDVKPENIIVTRGATVTAKMVDWGVAQRFAQCDEDATTVCGTPQYMAPEQLRGEPVDGRADVYALGVVAYEMLVGRQPFTGRTPVELASQHLHVAPLSICAARPDVPPAIEALIMAMLAKKPADRPSLEAARFGFSLIAEAQDELVLLEGWLVPHPEPGADVVRASAPRPRWTPAEVRLPSRETRRLRNNVVASEGRAHASAAGTVYASRARH